MPRQPPLDKPRIAITRTADLDIPLRSRHDTVLIGDAMKPFILFLLLISSGLALADPDINARLAQLETTINRLQQEQQSLYQQFQMMQELRKIEMDANSPGTQNLSSMESVDSRSVNYDEKIGLQRERQERIQKYTSDLGKLNSRYSELADQKKALLDQMIELSQRPKR
jgi:septal ring factor EnvC (AmiA/AmiB activator)